MKRRKTIIILAAVFACLIAVIAIEKAAVRHVDKINTIDEIITDISPDDVTAISLKTADGTLALSLEDGTWQDSSDAAFPIDQDTVSDFLSHFESIHACFVIDDVADYSPYGLEDPEATVTLTIADADPLIVDLGGYSTMDSQRYVGIGDDKAYLVEDDLMEYVSVDRNAFMLNDTPPEITTITDISIQGANDLHIFRDEELVCDYNDYSDWFIELDGVNYPLSDSNARTLVQNINGIGFTDYTTYTASSEDLSSYGLTDPSAITITITGKANDGDDAELNSYTITLGHVVTQEADEENEEECSASVRMGESEIIYSLSPDVYHAIAEADYDSLRPSELLHLDWDTVNGITFTLDGIDYELTRTENNAEDSDDKESDDDQEDEYIWLLGEKEVDISDLKSAANALAAESFETADKGNTQEVAVTFTLDNEDYPSVSAALYRYDSSDCLALINGEQAGLVSRSLMADLKEACTALTLAADKSE